MKNKLKNTLLKKTYISAVFPLRGPASAFVGCWGLRGLSWISCTSKKNTFKKKTYLLMAQTTPDASFGPFSLFVNFLFPLRGLPFPSSSALVGCCGPSWAFMAVVRAKEGVWWVWSLVQPAKLYSTQPPAWRVCTGRVTDSGMHGSGVLPGIPAPVPAGTRTRDPWGLA